MPCKTVTVEGSKSELDDLDGNQQKGQNLIQNLTKTAKDNPGLTLATIGAVGYTLTDTDPKETIKKVRNK